MAATLTELLARVRRLADIEDSLFFSDAELTDYINAACYALDDVLHATWEDYFSTTANVSFLGTSYALPADFFKLVSVDVLGRDGKWRGLRSFSLADRNGLRSLPASSVSATRYRVEGSNLSLLPGFTSATQATITYYPKRPALVLTTDTRDYPNGWEQWAVVKAAIFALTKEERSTDGLEKLLAWEDSRVRQNAPQRDERPVSILPATDCRAPWEW